MNRKRLTQSCLLACCLLSILFTGCSDSAAEQDSNIVASVGDDYTLQFSRVHTFHQNHEFGARFPDSELNGYEEVLHLLITNRLKHVDFYESGMHRDSAIALELQRIINDELINDYYEKEYLAKYVNEESIDEYYEGMQKEIHYQRIALEKSQSGGQEFRQQTEETIDDILTAAEDGESFETLINIYSRESIVSNSEGSLRTVLWNANSGNQLFNQMYNLNEGDLKVLETASSYLIVKVERVSEREAPPLGQVRDEIERNLRMLYSNRSEDEFEEEKDRIVNQSEFQWNQAGLEQLVEWSSIPNFYDDVYRDTLKRKIQTGDNFVILDYSNGQIDAEEYLRLLDNVYIMESSGSANIEEHKAFIIEALKRDRIINKAKELGLDEDILHPNHSNITLRNRAIQLYNERHIDSKIPVPNQQDLREFYEMQKDTLYYQLPRARIFAVVYDDSSEAVNAVQQYQEGTRFEDLEPSYLVRSFQKNREGTIESYIRRGEPYLGEAAFSLSLDEVAGPVSFEHAENGRQFAVIKRTQTVPEKQLTYSEVENRIAEDYKEYHRKRIVQSVKNDLWNRYPVTIYEDNLRQRISSL